jgi:hypothetical protein
MLHDDVIIYWNSPLALWTFDKRQVFVWFHEDYIQLTDFALLPGLTVRALKTRHGSFST